VLDLGKWRSELIRGAVKPFSLTLESATAECRVTSVRESSMDDWHEAVLDYAIATPQGEAPLTAHLTARFDESFSLVRLTLALHAKKTGAAPSRATLHAEKTGTVPSRATLHAEKTGTVPSRSGTRSLGTVPVFSEVAIRQIKILDLLAPDEDNEQTRTLYGLSGGFMYEPSDFQIEGIFQSGPTRPFPLDSLKPWEKAIGKGEKYVLDSDRTGRSSNSQIPIWVYADSGQGLWLGPEWSGCWGLEVRREQDGSRLLIGLPTFDFTMCEGEKIELPTAAFGVYTGKPHAGFNALRRAIHKHYLPSVTSPDGQERQKPQPPVLFQGLGGLPAYQDEKTLYAEADRAAAVGCEAFVLDAGWYCFPPVNWWENMGEWRPDAERFPSGVDKFADYVHSKGMRFGLWIEPRMALTVDAFDHARDIFLAPSPEVVAPYGSHAPFFSQAMLDLGKAAAQDWFTCELECLISEYHADWIWFDFNTDPRMQHWDEREGRARKGLMELRFYQGMYKVFETVAGRHPNVWLETCSSGGRMIDLAQLRRFHSIWVNDLSMDDDQNRNFRGALSRVLPAVCIQNAFFLNDRILFSAPEDRRLHTANRFLTCFGGAFQFGQGLAYWEDDAIRTAARYTALYKEYRCYLDKEYYHTLPIPSSRDAWDAWQYHDPETDSGIVLVFRLGQSQEDKKVVPLEGLNPHQQYSFTVVDSDAAIEESGRALTVGMERGNAILVHYRAA